MAYFKNPTRQAQYFEIIEKLRPFKDTKRFDQEATVSLDQYGQSIQILFSQEKGEINSPPASSAGYKFFNGYCGQIPLVWIMARPLKQKDKKIKSSKARINHWFILIFLPK